MIIFPYLKYSYLKKKELISFILLIPYLKKKQEIREIQEGSIEELMKRVITFGKTKRTFNKS